MTEPQKTPEMEDHQEPFRAFATEDEYRTHLEHVTKERTKRAQSSKEKELLERFEVEDLDDLEEIVSEYKGIQEAVQTETQALEEQAKKAEKKQAALKESLATIEAERDSANERTQELEQLVTDFVTPRLEQIEEHYRELIDEWPVEKQARWLTKNADKIGAPPERPSGSRPTGRPQLVPKGEDDKEAREGQRRARVSAI